MSTTSQNVTRWREEHPNQPFLLLIATVVLAGSVWIGTRSHAMTSRLTARRPAWQSTADQLATVRQQFRAPSSSETASLLAESGREGALGVPSSERVSLMELVTRVADASGLTDIQVSFHAGADSAFVPPRPIGGAVLNPATYSIAIDVAGSFAGVVQFVSNLPPSVSLSRLGAARRGDRAVYHILLSVYELPNGDSAS
jgi:hypothetical protein